MKQTIENILISAEHKFVALLAVVLLAVAVPTSLLAWGPDRPTYTIENPADHITFNSITNNPNYGDERNFVTIKDAENTNAGGWVDEIAVQNDKEYYVRMYVHNNAADNLNLTAQNVTAKFNVPDYASTRIQIDGYLSSTNANPTEVWDQAVFTGTTDFELDYIEGSASYTNNVFTDGVALSDNVVSSGALLGYSQLNGQIPGCYQYSGLVIFKVKALTNDFLIQKTVRINGIEDKTFKENISVNPGDKIDYQIYFKNTGGTQLTDVIIKDTLPAGVIYTNDTTYVYNSGNGLHKVNDGITSAGINIGGYLPGGDAYIKFSAQVVENSKLILCGNNNLVNSASAITEIGSKSDTAQVTTEKTCNTNTIVTTDTEKPTETPKELPKTGIGESIMTAVALGTLITSVSYYIASRRKLHHAKHHSHA